MRVTCSIDAIQIDISARFQCQLKEKTSGSLDTKFFKYNRPACTTPDYINSRETCGRHELPSGSYCVVVTTFKQHEEADFLLRIFSEKAVATK
jgi:calpain